MTKKTETNDHYLRELRENLPEEIPNVLLFYTLKQGRKVDIRLEVTGDRQLKLSDDNPLEVELISQEGDLLMKPVRVNLADLTASLTIDENIKQGSYILQVTYQNWVLDSTTFEVLDEESAQQMEEFDRGLEIQDQVYEAIEESNYGKAFNLQKEVAQHFLNANNPELAANSWEDLADILDDKNQLAFSKHSLQDALEIYSDIEELENREEILTRILETIEKYPSFVSNIKPLREATGLSQQGLAFLSDVSLKTIQNWEQGQQLEPLPQYLKLSQKLGCKITDLLGYKGVGLSIQPISNIKKLREKKGLSLEGLAFELNVSRITLQEWENDPNKIAQCIKQYAKLAEALKCNIDDLIEFIDISSERKPIESSFSTEPLPENSTKKEI